MSGSRHRSYRGPFDRVVIAASLGGIQACGTVLSGLPADFPLPVAVVVHRLAHKGPDFLPAIYARKTDLPVRGAEDRTSADTPGVTVIPAATRADVDAHGQWQLHACSTNAGVADALLSSAAQRGPTIAVILTGRLDDGSAALGAVKRGGGRVLVQNPAQAQASGMPASAIATGFVDFVLPIERIAPALVAVGVAPGGADLLTVPPPPWAQSCL